jgi:hypothetical protein
MFSEFFGKASHLLPHHQLILSLVVFTGISAIWWAGYVLFDEFFLAKIKTHYRVLFAFLIGIAILVGTHQVVNNMM